MHWLWKVILQNICWWKIQFFAYLSKIWVWIKENLSQAQKHLNFNARSVLKKAKELANTAALLAGWRRVTQQGVILYMMGGLLHSTCPSWPDLWGWSITKHRHELHHARKAWSSALVDQCLLSGYTLPRPCPHYSWFRNNLLYALFSRSTKYCL